MSDWQITDYRLRHATAGTFAVYVDVGGARATRTVRHEGATGFEPADYTTTSLGWFVSVDDAKAYVERFIAELDASTGEQLEADRAQVTL